MTEMSFDCRPERPWGIHPTLFNDEDCPRCGWTAPGPVGDARAEAEAALAAGEPGWAMIEGGVP
ncbi:MAG: hypothetical protein ACJ8EB_03855 [Allosphingosinicella sp.]